MIGLRKLRRLILPSWQDLWPEIVQRASKEPTLQLGSGLATRLKGAINVDVNPNTKPDVLCDLDCLPYPFEGKTFDMVVAISILEHLKDFFAVMGEIHRISKPGASVFILVPHFSSAAAFVDPTHRVYLSARSCDYFIEGSDIEKEYGFYMPYRYSLKKRYIQLAGIFNYIPPLRWLVGRYPAFWENYLCYIIRGAGIFWELKVIKNSGDE